MSTLARFGNQTRELKPELESYKTHKRYLLHSL